MESYHQHQEYLGFSFFQPIYSDLSYDNHDDEPTYSQELFNKSIFRQPEDDGIGSPPTVSRANPIGMEEDDDDSSCHDEAFYNVITPYPYSICQEELEDRQSLESEIPRLATLSSIGEARDVIDYSFYFETDMRLEPQQIWDDGIAQSCVTQTDSCISEMRRVSFSTQISDTESMGEGN
ncbi:hypothetical protein MHU86_12764 [Fragilaria crotonensis]|nr:hypothetical protein MHU86_12764 [Fragilaria crotonensis]